jgi:hypothetical protein
MNENTLIALLSDREKLKIELWNNDWIFTYTINNHTLHCKDASLEEGLKYLLSWRNHESK